MPKLKTHKGAKARFHITGTGKIMRVKGPKSHLRRNKAKRVRSLFDEKIQLHAADRKRIQRLIPYGVK
ncbi:MAG: 50S ribosomal protein L35 [Dehalococcoidales bacterium]|jgi:large subunit ribosomal protein L35|nr:50S ribosomal protein L35 [Dehalococcoidales bacterium]